MNGRIDSGGAISGIAGNEWEASGEVPTAPGECSCGLRWLQFLTFTFDSLKEETETNNE